MVVGGTSVYFDNNTSHLYHPKQSLSLLMRSRVKSE